MIEYQKEEEAKNNFLTLDIARAKALPIWNVSKCDFIETSPKILTLIFYLQTNKRIREEYNEKAARVDFDIVAEVKKKADAEKAALASEQALLKQAKVNMIRDLEELVANESNLEIFLSLILVWAAHEHFFF